MKYSAITRSQKLIVLCNKIHCHVDSFNGNENTKKLYYYTALAIII